MPGGADRSYGLHVARLAGLPADVLARAATLLEGEGPTPPAPLPWMERGSRRDETPSPNRLPP